MLRPSLLPGLMDACAHNRRRGRKDVQLFETGSRFTPAGEGRAAASPGAAPRTRPHWSSPRASGGLLRRQGRRRAAVRRARLPTASLDFARFAPCVPGPGPRRRRPTAADAAHRHRRPAGARRSRRRAGFPAGEAHLRGRDRSRCGHRRGSGRALRAESLPRFPSIVRDLSILVDETLPAAAVRGTIRSSAPSTLVSIVEFDRYQGKGVPAGRVSLSLRLTFRDPERTLTDEDAQQATERIVQALRAEHGAEQR